MPRALVAYSSGFRVLAGGLWSSAGACGEHLSLRIKVPWIGFGNSNLITKSAWRTCLIQPRQGPLSNAYCPRVRQAAG